MVWAIIKSGNKQYKVKPNDVISIEYGSQEDGKKIEFDEVLLLAKEDKIIVGRPIIDKAKVKGTVIESRKGPKIRVIKFKPKSKYLKSFGFRRKTTNIRIDDIADS